MTNTDTNKKSNNKEVVYEDGDLVAFLKYAKVDDCSLQSTAYSPPRVSFKDLDGKVFMVEGKELLTQGISADFFAEEEAICKTEVIKKLTNSNGKPFTVVFQKQNGESRTLRGVYVLNDVGFGRSNVLDLDCKDSYNLRQVDHRTIESLILDGVKYIVKANYKKNK